MSRSPKTVTLETGRKRTMSVATFTAALIAGETSQEKLEKAVADGKLSLTDFAAIIGAAASAKASKGATRELSCKVTEKGGVSVYGLNARFPVTLYADQWERLAAFLPALQKYMQDPANKGRLSRK
jgi:hypothetical protein